MYIGLTDFGDDGPQSTSIDDQATHGLVLMFQPLADSYTRPIAVFASKNPVKGDELSKLVLKAISFLGNNGAKVHGVIGDGASTNNKMWSLLGGSGEMENTKTWFSHPLDDERRVFVFSDVPHVMECIRNRLYKKDLRMKSSNTHICWKYFEALYDADTKMVGNARVCRKITNRHVVLDSTAKMLVDLRLRFLATL